MTVTFRCWFLCFFTEEAKQIARTILPFLRKTKTLPSNVPKSAEATSPCFLFCTCLPVDLKHVKRYFYFCFSKDVFTTRAGSLHFIDCLLIPNLKKGSLLIGVIKKGSILAQSLKGKSVRQLDYWAQRQSVTFLFFCIVSMC